MPCPMRFFCRQCPSSVVFGLLCAVTQGCSSDSDAARQGQAAPLVVFEGFGAEPQSKGTSLAATQTPTAFGAAEVDRPARGTAAKTVAATGLGLGVGTPDFEDEDEPGIDLDAIPEPISESQPGPEPPTNNAQSVASEAQAIDDGAAKLAATVIAATVYKRPSTVAPKLGYVRLGGKVKRDEQPVSGNGCSGKWYRVYPHGFMCTDETSTDMDLPLVRAAHVRANLSKPLPYAYGFVRATAPQYLRVPSKADQLKAEFKLEEHLQWYRENFREIQRVELGANDIPLTERGAARLGVRAERGFRLSSQLSVTELLGGSSPEGEIPFWLKPSRQIPNVAAFGVPDYAVFADRVRRKTGLSFVDAFVARDEDIARRFAVTVDMRLIPATKVKPDTASPFHGVEVSEATPLPFAFVARRGAKTWRLIKGRDEAREDADTPRRAMVPLSGKVRLKAGQRFYQIGRMPTRWLKAEDVGVVALPPAFPPEADRGEKWIDISLVQQTLVLYEGRKPVYATLVSTGRDRLGDPKTSLATPQGTFRLQSKHIAAAMDSEENSSVGGGTRVGQRLQLSGDAAETTTRLLAAEKAGKKLSSDDEMRLKNIKKGRHPEYGVTMRRGSGGFELRDVPWIQYFAAGYALHGAYWHDVFGTPRSHGCVNLSPIDARYVFLWTGPDVPDGWHGINVSEDFGQGTLVRIRE
jgi:hypothetical protein